MKTRLSIFSLSCLLVCASLHADEKAVVPAIPSAYVDGRYQTTWHSNPFLRQSRPVEAVNTSWADPWQLAGMYKNVSGEVSVILRNAVTGDLKRVVTGSQGEFRLMKAGFHRNRDQAFVEIEKDGQMATLKYGETSVASHARRIIR